MKLSPWLKAQNGLSHQSDWQPPAQDASLFFKLNLNVLGQYSQSLVFNSTQRSLLF